MTPATRYALGLPPLPADQARRVQEQGEALQAGRYPQWPQGLTHLLQMAATGRKQIETPEAL